MDGENLACGCVSLLEGLLAHLVGREGEVLGGPDVGAQLVDLAQGEARLQSSDDVGVVFPPDDRLADLPLCAPGVEFKACAECLALGYMGYGGVERRLNMLNLHLLLPGCDRTK